MRSIGLLFGCLCFSYVFIRGILGTVVDIINWLLRILVGNSNTDEP